MARTVMKQGANKQAQFAMKMGPAATLAPAPAPRPVIRPKLTPVYDLSRLAPCPATPAADLAVEPAPADDGLPPSHSTYAEDRATAEPFGAWLVKQKDRGGLVGQLAAAAAGDRGLTRATTPHDLRRRLVEQQADGDMHDALDDAEVDWLAL